MLALTIAYAGLGVTPIARGALYGQSSGDPRAVRGGAGCRRCQRLLPLGSLERLAELVASINAASDLPLMVRAAIAHLNMSGIHPFLDGNGRLARVPPI
jgi:Fic/DOC family protein